MIYEEKNDASQCNYTSNNMVQRWRYTEMSQILAAPPGSTFITTTQIELNEILIAVGICLALASAGEQMNLRPRPFLSTKLPIHNILSWAAPISAYFSQTHSHIARGSQSPAAAAVKKLLLPRCTRTQYLALPPTPPSPKPSARSSTWNILQQSAHKFTAAQNSTHHRIQPSRRSRCVAADKNSGDSLHCGAVSCRYVVKMFQFSSWFSRRHGPCRGSRAVPAVWIQHSRQLLRRLLCRTP